MGIISRPISNDLDDANSISSRWGIQANEYVISGKRTDLQDLMVIVSKNRAISIEGEVGPQSTRIRNRNAELEELGEALADMTTQQTKFDPDKKDGEEKFQPSDTTKKTLSKFGINVGDYSKADVEGIIQNLKSMIDGRNNEAQLDMSRLQQLVDRRDESYSTATNLMTAISDTRANLIRNL